MCHVLLARLAPPIEEDPGKRLTAGGPGGGGFAEPPTLYGVNIPTVADVELLVEPTLARGRQDLKGYLAPELSSLHSRKDGARPASMELLPHLEGWISPGRGGGSQETLSSSTTGQPL